MNIIGILGKAGSGKDTIGKYLQEKYINTWTESFADPLKKACSAAFGIPLENFYDTSLKEEIVPGWEISPRVILQFIGTEMFRDKIPLLLPEVGNNFWVERMNMLLAGQIFTSEGATYDSTDTIVITDVRFQNEYDWILSRGGIVIQVTRTKSDSEEAGIPGHRSEAGLIPNVNNWFLISNNGTLEDLYEKVEEVITQSDIKLQFEHTQIYNRNN